MSDAETLAQYVDTWWKSIQDFTSLMDHVPEEEWSTPTDLPGWTVHDVVAHVAHLEHLSVGGAHDEVDGIEIGTPDHVHSGMSVFTEQGVVGRRTTAPAELLASIRRDTAQRHDDLTAGIPGGSQPADGLFGMIGWTWATLLRNRPLDVWMHEQDVRRAVGRPGDLDSVGADHSIDYLAAAWPVIVAKRAGAPAGATAVLAVENGTTVAVEVDETGRAQRLAEVPAEPTVSIAMGREEFAVGFGGRRSLGLDDVTVTGDLELAGAILAKLAATP
ncbi:maleylpyruvate isomerase family mycothiol-dependent enzyme [Nocardioides montaniterrae]